MTENVWHLLKSINHVGDTEWQTVSCLPENDPLYGRGSWDHHAGPFPTEEEAVNAIPGVVLVCSICTRRGYFKDEDDMDASSWIAGDWRDREGEPYCPECYRKPRPFYRVSLVIEQYQDNADDHPEWVDEEELDDFERVEDAKKFISDLLSWLAPDEE